MRSACFWGLWFGLEIIVLVREWWTAALILAGVGLIRFVGEKR